VYYVDWHVPDSTPSCPSLPNSACFNEVAAESANALRVNNKGLGTQFYYLAGGAESWVMNHADPKPKSPYCFGWDQANNATVHIHDSHYNLSGYNNYIFMDIEQDKSLGWYAGLDASKIAANRQVVNGFYDNIGGYAHKGDCAKRPTVWPGPRQPGIYSQPSSWTDALEGQTVPSTPVWTSSNCGPTCGPSRMATRPGSAVEESYSRDLVEVATEYS
jgi:hypothetical protein